jgi:acyl-homoserine lactone acylase PvdQ
LRTIVPFLLIVTALAIFADRCAAAGPVSGKVEILRDEYRVPHIFAPSVEAAAYASGYLQALDQRAVFLRSLVDAKPNRGQLSPKLQAIVEAFCAGANRAITEHPQAGDRNVQPAMVIAFSESVAAQLSQGKLSDGSIIHLSPERTASNLDIQVYDPLLPWDSAYQLVIQAPDYNWAGPTLLGLPLPISGHGARLGPDLMRLAAGIGLDGRSFLDLLWTWQTGDETAALSLAVPARALSTAESPSQRPSLKQLQQKQAQQMTQELLGFYDSFTLYDVLKIATSTEVYHAELWQKRIARADPKSAFARMISGWSRRMDADSPEALAYHLFKLALGPPEASALEPDESLSDNRIRAALRKAQDEFETKFPVKAAFGTLFKIAGQAASGASLPEVAMSSPRAIEYEKLGINRAGISGQIATQVVELSSPVPKSFMLIPQSGSPAKFARGEMQPTYFGNRRELEKHTKQRLELVIP